MILTEIAAITRHQVGNKLYFKAGQKFISPWHYLSWKLGDTVPFVCEIPKGTTAKMEVNLHNEHNPIEQDKHKNGNLRHWSMPPNFNYGMIPQTFESPDSKCPISGMFGDADPIDVVDISSPCLQIGEIRQAKVLGSFCLIDEGEADWKIVVSTNPNDSINIKQLQELFHFFETYKPNADNYIHNNRQVFTVAETCHVLNLARTNYRALIENSEKYQKDVSRMWLKTER